MLRTSSKTEIAKDYKNHEEFYKVIVNDYLNNGDGDMLYEIINDFDKWIVEHSYYDKIIVKNQVYENLDNSTDTDAGDSEKDRENWTDESDNCDYEPDEEFDEETPINKLFCHNGNNNIINVFL